jgi:hypothetical protein
VAVGAVISIVGALVDWLIGASEPPPEAAVCKYMTLEDPDAWAVLRLYAFASDEIPADTSMDEVSRPGSRGWGARFDPYTGEVLVQRPGEGYKRVLDAFDRNVLLNAYESGKLNEWLMGRQSIQGADPINVAGSPWLGSGSSEVRRALYCWLKPKDVMQRGFLSDRCSTARRFRVYESEFGRNANTRSDHGPKAIGWRLRMEKTGSGQDGGYWINHRCAMLVSAFLGGTTPYGQYDSGSVCTGVGGKVDPTNGTYWLPFTTTLGGRCRPMTGIPCVPGMGAGAGMITRWEPTLTNGRPEILVGPPMPRSTASGAPNPSTPGRYAPSVSGFRPLSFLEVAQEVLSNDTQRAAWAVPAKSPQMGEIATEPRFYTSVPTSVRRLVSVPRTFKSGLEPGMGRGTKIVLGIAGGAVVVGGGYLVGRHLRKRR